MQPLPLIQHANNASPFRLPSAKAARQRSGSDPITVSLLNTIHDNQMIQTGFREVFGSNIPLVASASTDDERFDQGVLQSAETLNAFVLTLGMNHLVREGTESLTSHWGKATIEGNKVFTHNQKMWQRFTASMPIYAWLVGFEFFSPLLRNMITLHRTGTDTFAEITDVKQGSGVSSHKNQPTTEEDVAEQRKRMREYQQLMVRDAAITVPSVALLLGVGLAGMKHNWHMPSLILNTPKALEKLLGKAKPDEHVLKKGVRKGGELLVENLFGSDAYHADKNHAGRLNLVDQALLPDKGDWGKVSNLMSTLVWAMPTYMALGLYSRDDLEKPEIGMRAGAFVIANLIFPNAIKKVLDAKITPKAYIPYIGGKQNISMLASMGLSTLLYTVLPVLASRLTREWRQEQIEKTKQNKHSLKNPS